MLTRRNLIVLAVVVVVLFVIALPNAWGAVSTIAWYLAFICLLLLIVLGLATLFQSRRSRA
jgi:ABC-type transport system involved in cytochrome c biogenesis permease component